MNSPKNQAQSVRQRLLNRKRATGEEFGRLLTRYALERLLYRLGQSTHRDRFILKGAALYSIWEQEAPALPFRPTRDLDLWSSGSPATQGIAQMFREVLTTPVEDDGLEFLLETLLTSVAGLNLAPKNSFRSAFATNSLLDCAFILIRSTFFSPCFSLLGSQRAFSDQTRNTGC